MATATDETSCLLQKMNLKTQLLVRDHTTCWANPQTPQKNEPEIVWPDLLGWSANHTNTRTDRIFRTATMNLCVDWSADPIIICRPLVFQVVSAVCQRLSTSSSLCEAAAPQKLRREVEPSRNGRSERTFWRPHRQSLTRPPTNAHTPIIWRFGSPLRCCLPRQESKQQQCLHELRDEHVLDTSEFSRA